MAKETTYKAKYLGGEVFEVETYVWADTVSGKPVKVLHATQQITVAQMDARAAHAKDSLKRTEGVLKAIKKAKPKK